MIPELREEFNRRWQPAHYAEFLRRLEEMSGTRVPFRCSETPVFLPAALLGKMARYGQELYAQLAGNAAYLAAAEDAIPPEFCAPNTTPQPLFLQADFGLVRESDGSLAPKLVEIQGFPSLYGFQIALAREYERSYRLKEINRRLSTFLGGLDHASYQALLETAILNGHDPREVVLLEVDPYEQKTLPDFLVTQHLFGIQIADIRELQKRGRKLYRKGAEVKRIYNRVIADELVRKRVVSDFRFTDDVEVEWAGHPNWFFQLSKFSLPWLRHESVPETWFLSDLPTPPDDLHEYVLKPLYSFAGQGVTLSPTREEVDAIPPRLRSSFILQRKMNFAPCLDTPRGPTKIEVRVMYIWNGSGMLPVTTLLRTGRGPMMGVDFNKNLDWVGASAGFSVRE